MPNAQPSSSPSLSHHRAHSLEQRWTNENHNPHEISPPPPAALTSRPFPRSIPLEEDEESYPARQPRTHQRSLTELFPTFLSNPSSPSRSRSPIKEISKKEFEDEFLPTLTGDKDNLIKVQDKSRAGALSSWFTGASAPVQLGMPITPEHNLPLQTSRQQKRLTNQSMESYTSYGSMPATPSSATSIFSGFFSSPRTKPSTQIQVSASLNDEYLNLDIDQALFPTGQSDPFSPAAFKNLLTNAEGILIKLQTAYKTRTVLLQDLLAEKEIQAEEYEEACIRAVSLKSQLELISHQLLQKDEQLSEKDLLIQELSDALTHEKQLRAEEAHAREKSIALLKANAEFIESEDLGFADASSTTPTRLSGNDRKHRSSYASTDISEDDDEAPSPAVFSRSMSPTSLATSNSSVLYQSSNNTSLAEIGEATFARVVNNPRASAFKPENVKPIRPKSTFQKVLAGMNGVGGGRIGGAALGMGGSKCSNCEGRDASFAWDTVGVLKAENKGLKEQVCILEDGVENALNIVTGYDFGLRAN